MLDQTHFKLIMKKTIITLMLILPTILFAQKINVSYTKGSTPIPLVGSDTLFVKRHTDGSIQKMLCSQFQPVGNYLTRGINTYVGSTSINNTGSILFNPTGNFTITAAGNETEVIGGTSTKDFSNNVSWRIPTGFSAFHIQAGATDFSQAFIAMQRGFGSLIGYSLSAPGETSALFDPLGVVTIKAGSNFKYIGGGIDFTMNNTHHIKTIGQSLSIYADNSIGSNAITIGDPTTPIVNIGAQTVIFINSTRINHVGPVVYANNAAAIVGGLFPGDEYFVIDATTGSYKLEIVQ